MTKAHTILVVDDSPDNLRILGHVLEEAGYEIVVATSGVAAFERCKLDPVPDLILLDVVMPGMDGFELLRRLKEEPATSTIPVILVSGIVDADTKIKGFQRGAVDYVTKPFHAEEVLARVNIHIQLTRIEQLQHEIVERERSEAALRQSEAILKKAQKAAHIGSWTWDIGRNKLEWSDEMFSIFGVSKETFSGNLQDVIRDAIHPDDREQVEASNHAVATKNRSEPLVYRVVHPDGNVRVVWAEAGELLLDENGNASILTGIVQDITERRRADEALRENQTRLNFAMEISGIGVWDLDLRTHAAFRSPRHDEIFGYSQPLSEWTYERFLEHVLESDRAAVDDKFRLAMESRGDWNFECRIRRADGQIRWIWAAGRHSGTGVDRGVRMSGIVQDITAQKQAENDRIQLELRLQQAQKLESIGRLAGGVAHDFNNMLGVIQGHAELVMLDTPETSPHYANLKTIFDATRRSSELTRQLLAFARKEVVAPRIIDLNENTAGILRMLDRLIGENVRLDWAPCPGLWPIRMDPSQFDQILANLCLNARDAIAGSGTISIRMANRTLQAKDCEPRAELVPGQYVEISVTDTGCGMDPETQARIFEPFFSTKGLGKGTGLGLATVYGAIKQNSGFIEVQSSVGSGTTFLILLPRELKGLAPDSSSLSDSPVPGRRETILLVEDDPSLLGMTKSMLELSGWTVLAAGNPSDAIELAKANADSVNLLVSDVVLPQMNGRELMTRLRQIAPRLKHLYVSGYTADIIATHGVLDKGVNFLQKPFSIKSLTHKVREVLDRNPDQDSSMV